MRGIFAFVAAVTFALSAPTVAQQPEPLVAASDPIHITTQAPLSGERDHPNDRWVITKEVAHHPDATERGGQAGAAIRVLGGEG